ncbi:hypothetical protein PGTUg99_013122 [Puccinia graminis f. sp. tritici]|uniref:Retrotransposon gag domain-containing protein n=1 Tax=Puccinia graminis f. sp. tritici TaxID=56615 RepID=A0A5B0RKW2_PUCGR|nr:hypothetical protein PGTUg99_013122 [Puccinia graminis f. sp. tritici]
MSHSLQVAKFDAGFAPRPVPSPDLGHLPSSPIHLPPSPVPLRRDDHQAVSSLLSGLCVDNPDRDQTLLGHAQSIANLELQCRRYEEALRKNEETISQFSQLLVFASHFTKMKTHYAKEFLQIRNNFDTSTNATNTRLFQLESRDYATPVSKSHFEPPHYSHLRALLTCNASKQDLPTKPASALAPFVLPELSDSDTFLSTIKDHFSSHTEEEDARKAFFALRQGTSSIADFNIQFNTLLYSVDLSPRLAVEHYERAINQKIIELGIQRGGWSELTDLDDMQRMAVKLSLDVGRVNQINQRKFTVPPPCVEYKTSITSQPAAKSSQSGPMDIDAVLAAVGFNWRLWHETCVARELCFRCVQLEMSLNTRVPVAGAGTCLKNPIFLTPAPARAARAGTRVPAPGTCRYLAHFCRQIYPEISPLNFCMTW